MVKTWRLWAKRTWLALRPQEQLADLFGFENTQALDGTRLPSASCAAFEIKEADRECRIRRMDGGPQNRHHWDSMAGLPLNGHIVRRLPRGHRGIRDHASAAARPRAAHCGNALLCRCACGACRTRAGPCVRARGIPSSCRCRAYGAA